MHVYNLSAARLQRSTIRQYLLWQTHIHTRTYTHIQTQITYTRLPRRIQVYTHTCARTHTQNTTLVQKLTLVFELLINYKSYPIINASFDKTKKPRAKTQNIFRPKLREIITNKEAKHTKHGCAGPDCCDNFSIMLSKRSVELSWESCEEGQCESGRWFEVMVDVVHTCMCVGGG